MEARKKWLKQLKGYITRLIVNQPNKEIVDRDFNFQIVCDAVEAILNKDLRISLSFSFLQIHFFDYLNDIFYNPEAMYLNKCYKFIEKVKESDKITTAAGRGRLLIRYCLVHSCLADLVETMRHSPQLYKYYTCNSIMGCDVSYEIFVSLIKSLAIIKFNLNLESVRFLDESWDIPNIEVLELVPCKVLGISVRYYKSHCFVLEIEEGSVAGEDDKVEVGDVIDEVCGITIGKSKGHNLSHVLALNKNKPIVIKLYKCHFSNGDLYFPIANLLDQQLVNIDKLRQKYALMYRQNSPNVEDANQENVPKKNGVLLKYNGKYNCGLNGGVGSLDEGISNVLKQKTSQEVLIKLEEVGLSILDSQTDEILLKFSFPEISACGRKSDMPLIFAFTAGNTTCNLATEFYCYVFTAKTQIMCKNIMLSIVDGFNRTNWTV